MEAVTRTKKLIEVALPLDDINKACVREKSIRHGHPSTLHLWWARRPLAAARAVIFAQMVDDPSQHPDLFPTEKDQERERERLFDLIRELVKWENTANQAVLNEARLQIVASWRSTCAENVGHENSDELFDPDRLPGFHDPFAGGGTLPLEAMRLGLESFASDLNPVAVLINKAMIEIPQRFAGMAPVNPSASAKKQLIEKHWSGFEGLAADISHYGAWMRDEAAARIGHLYPRIEMSAELALDRPDLKPLVGKQITAMAFIWARTVKSPNPAFSNVHVPLASTFMLGTKNRKKAYVEPVIDGGEYRFRVCLGQPGDETAVKNGTKLARANFTCILSGSPISGDYIKAEGKAGRMGARMLAIVAEGERQRVYLAPTNQMEDVAASAMPEWEPDELISGSTQYLGIKPYGMERFSQIFTSRQLVALATFSDLVQEVRERIKRDADAIWKSDDGVRLEADGCGSSAYADAVATYLGIGVSRLANRCATLNFWDSEGEKVQQVFARQAMSMTWDFVESNPFSSSSGNFLGQLEYLTNALKALPESGRGHASQDDAAKQRLTLGKVVATDPPYFDNVPYADLSDFFYIWLRRSLKRILPDLFTTVTVPKADELVAFAYRHKDKDDAGKFFMDGMREAMRRLVEQAHPGVPVSIFYAFRQSESDTEDGTVSTGWETFLAAVIHAGFEITGTWPVRTEYTGNLKTNRSALASSIVLVCRRRPISATTRTRREFLNALKAELPIALERLQKGNIAPVDLAQAAIGPGMAVFTRYLKVVDADGTELRVRDALALINQVLDEVLAAQEGDFDAESRFAVAWFEHSGYAEGEFGVADVLARAKNTAVSSLVEGGIASSRGSKFRLLTPRELDSDWDPLTSSRVTAWQVVHQIVRALESDGEHASALLVAKLGSKAEAARELAYRLYAVAERRKRAAEALSYNGLVQSWPEIVRLSRDVNAMQPVQTDLLEAF